MIQTSVHQRNSRRALLVVLAGAVAMAASTTSAFCQTIEPQNGGAQKPALSVSPIAGQKEVSVTINLPDFNGGVIYCESGSKPLTQAAAKAAAKSPVNVPCGGKLVAGQRVRVWLEDSNNTQVALADEVVAGGGAAAAPGQKGPSWDFAVEAHDGDKTVKVTILGTAPALQPSDAINGSIGNQVITGHGSDFKSGIFVTTVDPAPKQGDPISVTLNGTTWSGLVGPATAQISVAFAPDPKETQLSVSGFLDGDPTALANVKGVFVEVLNGTDLVQGPLDGGYDNVTYGFKATTTALAEGQSVHVHVCGSSAGVTTTGSTTANGTDITNVPATDMASITKGWTASGGSIPAGATITDIDTAKQTITVSKPAKSAADKVSLQLGPPGEQSCNQPTGAKTALVEINAHSDPITVTSLYDLGRAKVYFSVGAELQGSSGSLGNAAGFFAADIDENWFTWNRRKDALCFSALDSVSYIGQATRRSGTQECGKFQRRLLVNTYVEGQLTQIPTTSNSSSTSAGATASTPASSSLGSLTSAKGGYVEGGIYVPVLFGRMQWRYRGQSYAFFGAPLAKYAFLVPGGTAVGAASNFSVYRAYAAGFRLGHYQLPDDFSRHQPRLQSYLDITGGRWENFRESNGTRAVRLDVTGCFLIPFTPLSVGFDSNTGPGGAYFVLFAGMRLDVTSILNKVLPSTK